MNLPQEILQKYWGFDSFRSSQEQIINTVLEKKDVIALLPTGGGKSLCYQIPALANDGICLVISPLISLIRDQIESLESKGIKATTIQSKTSIDDIVTLFDNLKYGSFKFLYLSPERLQSELVIQKVSELNINLIAVDEAHCISEWGHDFRPSYRQIKNIKEVLPDVHMIALTATATHKVIDDIAENLELQNPAIFKKSFYRDHLAYQIFTLENKLGRLEQIFAKNKAPSIVYVNSRRKTEEISQHINSNGYKSSFYHGGMSAEDKFTAFNLWMKEETPIMVATNAFGMGIDKGNVKIVVHLDLPGSIENYVQEAGRGGRDGNKSFSVVLQNENDRIAFKRNTIENIPNISEIKEVHKKLYQYFQVAKGERIETRFDFNFQEFCNQYKFVQKKTAVIVRILKKNGIIHLNERFHQKSTVQFIVESYKLKNHKAQNTHAAQLIDFLLRSYPGIFQKEVKINEFLLAKKLGTTSLKVKEQLTKLHEHTIIEYHEANLHQELFFLMPREDDKTINRISKSIETYLHQQTKKAEDLLRFIENDQVCRSIQILHYFDEPEAQKCGMCDVCISKKKKKSVDLTQQLINLIKESQEISQQQIINRLEANPEDVLIHLRHLLSKDVLGITNDNKFFVK